MQVELWMQELRANLAPTPPQGHCQHPPRHALGKTSTEIPTGIKRFAHPRVTARGEVGFARGHSTGELPQGTPEQFLAFPRVLLYFWPFIQTWGTPQGCC